MNYEILINKENPIDLKYMFMIELQNINNITSYNTKIWR